MPNVVLITDCSLGEEDLKMGWVGEVHNLDRTRGWTEAVAAYTTETDFCRLFKDDMRGLYALSLLLTADAGLAERCFVAGLDDCIKGNPVFKDWAYAWSARHLATTGEVRILDWAAPSMVTHLAWGAALVKLAPALF